MNATSRGEPQYAQVARRERLALAWWLSPHRWLGWAQNTIQSITSTQQAGSEVVRIELAEPLAAVPTGFTVQAPPRVAIDLPGVGNALGATPSRSTRATCARSAWRRPGTARVWCST